MSLVAGLAYGMEHYIHLIRVGSVAQFRAIMVWLCETTSAAA